MIVMNFVQVVEKSWIGNGVCSAELVVSWIGAGDDGRDIWPRAFGLHHRSVRLGVRSSALFSRRRWALGWADRGGERENRSLGWPGLRIHSTMLHSLVGISVLEGAPFCVALLAS